MARKAQGLSINFIVIAVIAALILVLIVAFTVGGLSDSFKRFGDTSSSDLQAAQSACRSSCNQLKIVATSNEFSNSDFCRRVFDLDVDGDGKIGGHSDPDYVDWTADGRYLEGNLKCWDDPIGIDCTLSFRTEGGESISCASVGSRGESTGCFCMTERAQADRIETP